MKLATRIILMALSLGFITLQTSCESTGRQASDTHEMGGPRTPRMANELMPGAKPN